MPVDHAFSAVQFLPVIEQPGKIFCVGMNYADKRQEFAATLDAPTLFIRFADSLTGHEQPLQKPLTTQEFDYEGELAVIIGKPAHRVKAADALDVIAGYSCFYGCHRARHAVYLVYRREKLAADRRIWPLDDDCGRDS